MHSTNDLEDGYLGSGKVLRYSINKYSKKNHKLEILEYLDSRELLKEREKELITEDMLKDPMCMNLGLGGVGGLQNVEHAEKFHKAGGKKVFQLLSKRHSDKLKTDKEYKKKYSESMSKATAGDKNGFYGKTHSDETKEKMKKSTVGKHIGKLNSQYGTCWINNKEKVIKIKKEELDSYLNKGWFKGRKI